MQVCSDLSCDLWRDESKKELFSGSSLAVNLGLMTKRVSLSGAEPRARSGLSDRQKSVDRSEGNSPPTYPHCGRRKASSVRHSPPCLLVVQWNSKTY